ncbi:hypothetical protein CPB83DRAFT_897551 [Crepidotus variabilis]|uniref:Transmembrane protein n=1 Tax=Crepidotus variabilis TaxID=179855 RepID=A0A9P6JLI1_9AGAR|nr:hypothetical protein CPB83DRAFT_897551 [Crepidotus variabilis]
MSNRAVIVDNQDLGIDYVGNSWKSDQGNRNLIGNYGPQFKGSLHGTDSPASLSFQFSGTSVKVYGSNVDHDTTGSLNPRWECFIDQRSIGASKPFAFQENNWNFCEDLDVPDGLHTLTVNVTVSQNQTFWFDRIEYIPSQTDWKKAGTANMTQTHGASFEFDFNGVSVSWFSWVLAEYPKNSTSGTYAIDGGSPQTFTISGNSADPTQTLYNQELFETPTLPMGQHTLSVLYNGNGNTTPLTLDYLVVQNGTGTTPQTPSDTGSKVGNNNNNNDNPLPPTRKSNVGAITGGVLAPVSVIIILSIVFIFFRRRRKFHHEDTPVAQVEPFHHQSIYASSPTWGHPRNSIQSPNSSDTDTSGGYHVMSRKLARASGGSDFRANGAATPSRTAPTPPTGNFRSDLRLSQKISEMAQRGSQPSSISDGSSPRVIRHEDSGRRDVHHVNGSSDDIIELPPQYTPA